MHLTRRVFLSLIGAAPLIRAVWAKLSPPLDSRGFESPIPIDGIGYSERSPVPSRCLECCGLGRTFCLACDGTGLWSEASESAGLYEREWAERTGRCAWCNEWGEAECTLCDGRGAILLAEASFIGGEELEHMQP
jgi:hypothetical protein